MEDINLDDYDEMGTSITKIKNPNENKELFLDIERNKINNGQCNIGKKNVNFNMNNFIKNLEDNLDNFDNTETSDGPIASNNDFKSHRKESFIESLSNTEDNEDDSDEEDEESVEETEETTDINWNQKIYDLLLKVREPFIIILLFVLLNNNDLVYMVNKLPLISELDEPYPSLIFRGLLLAIIIYYLRKMENSTTL